jgi:hypothetical protein
LRPHSGYSPSEEISSTCLQQPVCGGVLYRSAPRVAQEHRAANGANNTLNNTLTCPCLLAQLLMDFMSTPPHGEATPPPRRSTSPTTSHHLDARCTDKSSGSRLSAAMDRRCPRPRAFRHPLAACARLRAAALGEHFL